MKHIFFLLQIIWKFPLDRIIVTAITHCVRAKTVISFRDVIVRINPTDDVKSSEQRFLTRYRPVESLLSQVDGNGQVALID